MYFLEIFDLLTLLEKFLHLKRDQYIFVLRKENEDTEY